MKPGVGVGFSAGVGISVGSAPVVGEGVAVAGSVGEGVGVNAVTVAVAVTSVVAALGVATGVAEGVEVTRMTLMNVGEGEGVRDGVGLMTAVGEGVRAVAWAVGVFVARTVGVGVCVGAGVGVELGLVVGVGVADGGSVAVRVAVGVFVAVASLGQVVASTLEPCPGEIGPKQLSPWLASSCSMYQTWDGAGRLSSS